MLACNLSFEYFLCACYCVSTPIYIFVSWVLARVPSSGQVLCTSFFRIVIWNGIVDIIVATTSYCGIKSLLYGWGYDFYAQAPFVLKYISCISFSTCYSQSICAVLIAFNRYTALALPLQHHVIILMRLVTNKK
jgi:hypothetical protein